MTQQALAGQQHATHSRPVEKDVLSAPLVVSGTAWGPWSDLTRDLWARTAGAHVVRLADEVLDGQDDAALADAIALALGSVPPGHFLVLTDERLASRADAVSAALPRHRRLLLVESPATALSRALEVERSLDLPAFLAGWRRCAEAMIALASWQGGPTLMLDADEVGAHPAALPDVLGSGLGVLVGRVPAADRLLAGPPLARGVAAGLVDPETRWLHAELLARCTPLAVATPSTRGHDEWTPEQAGAVVQAFQAASQATRDAVRWQEERARLAERLRESEATAVRARELERQNQVLARRAEQMLEELEYLHAGQRGPRGAEGAGMAAAAAPAGLAPRAASALARIVTGEPRLTPPHLELPFRAERVTLAGRDIARVDARLVEHHGRAGLVVFHVDGDAVLGRLPTDGDEDGRAFLLLVPSDPGQAQRLDSSSFRAMLDLSMALRDALASTAVPAFWVGVASRLVVQATEAGRFFRHDGVKTRAGEVPPGGQQASTVELVFDRPAAGPLRLPSLALRWSVQGNAEVVELLRPESSAALPPSWPCEPGGAALPAWRLPVGALAPEAKRAAWAAMAPAERDLIAGALSSLAEPGVAGALPDWARPRASALAHDVRHHVRPSPWRNALRALRDALRPQ